MRTAKWTGSVEAVCHGAVMALSHRRGKRIRVPIGGFKVAGIGVSVDAKNLTKGARNSAIKKAARAFLSGGLVKPVLQSVRVT